MTDGTEHEDYEMKYYLYNKIDYDKRYLPLVNSVYEGERELLDKAIFEMLTDVNSKPNKPPKNDELRQFYNLLQSHLRQPVVFKSLPDATFDSLYINELNGKKTFLMKCLTDSVRNLPLPNSYALGILHEYLEFSSSEVFKNYWFINQEKKFQITSTLQDAVSKQSVVLKKFIDDRGWGDESNSIGFDLFRTDKNDVFYFTRIKTEYAEQVYQELLKVTYPQDAKLDKKVFDFQHKMLLDFFEKAKSENYIALTQNWD